MQLYIKVLRQKDRRRKVHLQLQLLHFFSYILKRLKIYLKPIRRVKLANPEYFNIDNMSIICAHFYYNYYYFIAIANIIV